MGVLSAFFLSPLFLIGALTGAIPIIIHLLHRRRAPQVFFSTLRFLKICVLKTARRRRIENLLLLLLRVALLVLLSMALARPFLKSGAFGATQRNIVMIMDNSLSMACRHQGKSRYDSAKDAALGIIQGLSSKDLCTMVFTSGPKSRQKRSLTHDREVLAVELAESRVYGSGSSIPAAIARARALLKEAEVGAGEIYIFTDMRKSAWEGSIQDLGESEVKAPIIIYDFGRSDFKDLAITGLEVGPGARVAGSPVRLFVDVLNSSPEDQQATVSLYVAGQKRQQKTVPVRSGATARVVFQHTFERGGLAEGYVQLEDDSLDLDNTRYFVTEISPQLNVLIIAGRKSAVPFEDSTFYLKSALNPFSDREAELFSIQPKVIGITELKKERIGNYGLVFLLETPEITVSDALTLQDYVEGGGNIIISCGQSVSSEDYNTVFEKIRKPSGTLLPGKLRVPVKRDPEGKSFWSVRQVDFEHPIFEPFRTVGIGAFDDIHVYEYMPVVTKDEPSARVLARYENDAPFLIEKRFGKGRVYLFTTTLDASWSNFPLKNIYLPLIHSMTYYLAGKEALERNYFCGDRVTLTFPQATSPVALEITDPSGATKQLKSTPEEPTEITYDESFATGIYRYRGERRELSGGFAVNFEPEAARLDRIDSLSVERILASEKHYQVRSNQELASVQAMIRRGIGLEDLFLFAVLAIILMEGFFANRARAQAKQEEAGLPLEEAA